MQKYYFNFNLRTDVGLVRENNEDAIAGSYNTLVVSDGVGGYPDGERASTYVVQEVINAVTHNDFDEKDTRQAIEDAVHKARVKLYENHSWGNTTMVAAVINDDILHVMNVGDSRGYVFRDGNLTPLTKDQSAVQYLVDSGQITEKEALYHPARNVIDETIHGEIYKPARIDFSTEKIQQGDIILLCTDGLTDLMIDKDIETIIRDNINKGLQSVNDALIKAAFSIDDDILVAGKDNTTIALGEVEERTEDAVLPDTEIYTFYEEK